MNESKNVIWINEINSRRTRSNNLEIVALVNRFLDITRKEWLAMNEARDIDYLDTAYESSWDAVPVKTRNAEIIPLVSKSKHPGENIANTMTFEYLNEKMYSFYNNGGPTMEL